MLRIKQDVEGMFENSFLNINMVMFMLPSHYHNVSTVSLNREKVTPLGLKTHCGKFA